MLDVILSKTKKLGPRGILVMIARKSLVLVSREGGSVELLDTERGHRAIGWIPGMTSREVDCVCVLEDGTWIGGSRDRTVFRLDFGRRRHAESVCEKG